MLTQTLNRFKQHNVLRTSPLRSPSEGMHALLHFLDKEHGTVIDFAKRTRNFYKVFQKTINNSYWAIKAIYSKAIYTIYFTIYIFRLYSMS